MGRLVMFSALENGRQYTTKLMNLELLQYYMSRSKLTAPDT